MKLYWKKLSVIVLKNSGISGVSKDDLNLDTCSRLPAALNMSFSKVIFATFFETRLGWLLLIDSSNAEYALVTVPSTI